ncbi:MAG: thiamine-phosphate kinase [Methanosarcinales archaeon]|nr:thiamine-phosphate kinase [Methanosarcinales archaeon]
MTKIKNIKERELISLITGILEKNQNHINQAPDQYIGPGKDDCAVIDIGISKLLVASTDMLHSTTDFPPGMTPQQMGWMSVAVNLSDIAAMGASPIGIMMALGLPPDLELDFVEALVRGMDECARHSGTVIIGGDIDRHDEITITGSALGLVDAEIIVLRKGAQIGDLVCVTGELGTAGAALDALMHNRSTDRSVLDKLYQPVVRIPEGISLAQTGCLTSMMDISDGLALSLYDIAAVSNVGFHIQANSIPIHNDVRSLAYNEDELFNWSIYTGGDFELLFTIRPECLEKLNNKTPVQYTVIGEVIQKGMIIEQHGNVTEMKARGFTQF